MKYTILLNIAIISLISFINTEAAIKSQNHDSIWERIIIDNPSESERLAIVDYQRYISQVTGVIPKIDNLKSWQQNPKPGVIVGSASKNSLLNDIFSEYDKIDNQGFYLANSKINGTKVIVAGGTTSEGAVNAIYGLLRELGFGFYLGSEAVPDSLPDRLKSDKTINNPVFKIRGVLPWYNFFNSPTTWDPIDHRAFVDQLIRMGANFVGFHTYDGEPFAGYEENGRFVWGNRLLNTGNPTWGTTPLKTDDFGFDTGKLFPDIYFGAESTLSIKDDNEAIKTEQNIMRDALDYAKKRGLHPCIGFEMWGDPLNPKDRDVFIKRINHVLNKYPSAEYIWIWQAETQGAQGYPEKYNTHILPYNLNKDSHLDVYGIAMREKFKRIVQESKGQAPFFQDNGQGEAARANEGARLALFANLALNVFRQRSDAPKLVISGWGGETRILSAEYYDGLDKLLPDDVVFSSLDFIAPLPKVDSIYGQLPPDRNRWPIIWLENDGDQWHPQPYVHILEKTMRDAYKGGSQGILGIHWRTRDIEENFAYLTQYSWNPKLDAKEFFRDLAERCYDKDIANEMADIHNELDLLGYRWVGGGGQNECAPFTWGPGNDENLTKLSAIREKIVKLLAASKRGKNRLEWLITNIDWVIAYQNSEAAIVKVKQILQKAENTDIIESKKLANEAHILMEENNLRKAMQTFALRVSTRGEYGVLATINTKAFVDWDNTKKRIYKIIGDPKIKESPSFIGTGKIILPRLITSIEENKDLILNPIAIGGGDIKLYYRSIGDMKWKKKDAIDSIKWIKNFMIESDEIKSPGIEICFTSDESPSGLDDSDIITISVLPKIGIRSITKPVLENQSTEKIISSFTKNPAMPIELLWNDISGVEYYRIFRNGQNIAETPAPMFPDNPTEKTGVYRIQAISGSNVIAESDDIKYKVNNINTSVNIKIQVLSNASGVVLQWKPTENPAVIQYKISRKSADDANIPVTECGELIASRGVKNSFRDVPPTGRWIYQIIPVAISGETGKPISATVSFKANKDIKPVIELPLDTKLDSGKINGTVSFSKDGAKFAGGYITLPHQSEMNMNNAMSLTFEFKADDIPAMPVLISHGLWLTDGWFVQILNGTLMVKTPRSDISGPSIYPGEWYKVVFIYDGDMIGLKVNDKWYAHGTTDIKDIPANRNLIIGQYEALTSDFEFHGTIRNIKIYNDVITE